MKNHFDSGISIFRRFQKSFEYNAIAMFRNVAVINLDTKNVIDFIIIDFLFFMK